MSSTAGSWWPSISAKWVASPRTLSYTAASIQTRSVQLGVPHSQRISSFSDPEITTDRDDPLVDVPVQGLNLRVAGSSRSPFAGVSRSTVEHVCENGLRRKTSREPAERQAAQRRSHP